MCRRLLQLFLNMSKKTRRITLAAVFTALTLIFLYLANILPAVRLGFTAAASLFAVAAVIETGIVSALFVFVGSSVIGALLLPDKTAVITYVLFFGYYPVIKSLAEKSRSRLLNWTLKFAVFEASFTLIWFLFRNLIFDVKVLGPFNLCLSDRYVRISCF
jgi:predicted membrane protein